MGMRLERRLERSRKLEYLVPVLSVLLSLVVSAVLLLATGVNPLVAYGAMVKEAFGTSYGFAEVSEAAHQVKAAVLQEVQGKRRGDGLALSYRGHGQHVLPRRAAFGRISRSRRACGAC